MHVSVNIENFKFASMTQVKLFKKMWRHFHMKFLFCFQQVLTWDTSV